MLQLPNGCRCSELTVFPSNWDKAGASVKKDWRIQFYFFDPLHKKRYPSGKYCPIKGGMNRLHTLAERREAVKILLEEIQQLLEGGYNPITKITTAPIDIAAAIDPATPFIAALRRAQHEMDVTKKCKLDLTSVVKYTELAAVQLKLSTLPICDVKRRHIKLIMGQLAKTKKAWSDNTHNYYRAHLMMLFNELLEYDAIETNPAKDLKKNATIKKQRQTLSAEETAIIDAFTRERFPRMNLLIHIFYHSGARTTEIFRVQGKDVNLKEQTVKYTILKGKNPREVTRPIKDVALPHWIQAMENCRPEDFVFSKGLEPGPVAISSNQMTRRWKCHIKGKDKIKDGLTIIADWYSLKHLNTTRTSEALGSADAAKQNEQDEALVVKIYDTNYKKRQDERIKKVDHRFGS